ncbi:class I SAM-dependent methyltransferase [Robertmurraya kyonggiensis]|uniref:Class I SAM-dependent methyltransferase n=1 Tax=Robertmurraya kyonggiensis TaxID=1037680 RepID=A0A4U1D8H9_9BACI|nr:class I SAM-dependent methyltransferase [Robertmurraya kyonggiensis]TKC18865.1 class I SAM-dependent methyltransferase [Robertmurraya kyonggiensis]
MVIDFHDEKNRFSYTNRIADVSWTNFIKSIVPIQEISAAIDIGCGGGIYTKALSDMGISSVIGLDFSEAMLACAAENCKEYQNIFFKRGRALHTGLEGNRFDLILERALIHHIEDLSSCFKEAYRLLRNNGYFIVQDRTPDDCLLEGDNSHIRGHFFEPFPKLIEKETNRRHQSKNVMEMLKECGFREIQEMQLWETRKVYPHKTELLQDLRNRTGRSILQELDDNELKKLINFIDIQVPLDHTIVEKDRWTIWWAIK